MPYYVYKLLPAGLMVYQDHFSDYRSAKRTINELRQGEPEGSLATYRMMHANDQERAEELLAIPRDGRTIGDD